MRHVATAILVLAALTSDACTGVVDTPRSEGGGKSGGGSGGTGSGGVTVSTDDAGSGGAGSVEAGTAGSGGGGNGGAAGSAGSLGSAGSTGAGGTMGAAGSDGAAGAVGPVGGRAGGGSAGGGTSGTGGMPGMGGAGPGLRKGPFKIIVLSSALVAAHNSIPTCFTMLQELGKASAPERAKIAGLAADATWTVDQIGSDPKSPTYFSEVTAENLKNYEMFYSNNPTGAVFTDAPDGARRKQAFVDYWNNGGSWAGQHSATDFEKGSWSWFQDNIDGGYFVDHDPPTTMGQVVWQPEFVDHPLLKGLASPWSTTDEWYIVNRNIETVPGFKVIAKVAINSSKGASPRPAVWIRENPNGKGGRSFYTIRGHDPKVYAEAEFRELMLRGILWSVHRLPGGN